jgi:hypothetical protein
MSANTVNVIQKITPDATHVGDSRIVDNGTDITIGEPDSFDGVISITAQPSNGLEISNYVQDTNDASNYAELNVNVSTIECIATVYANNAAVTCNGLTSVISITAGGGIAQSAPASTTASSLQNGQISFYLDEMGNALKVAVKYSNGTTKTGTIALL